MESLMCDHLAIEHINLPYRVIGPCIPVLSIIMLSYFSLKFIVFLTNLNREKDSRSVKSFTVSCL